jgi:hypothetical protein
MPRQIPLIANLTLWRLQANELVAIVEIHSHEMFEVLGQQDNQR